MTNRAGPQSGSETIAGKATSGAGGKVRGGFARLTGKAGIASLVGGAVLLVGLILLFILFQTGKICAVSGLSGKGVDAITACEPNATLVLRQIRGDRERLKEYAGLLSREPAFAREMLVEIARRYPADVDEIVFADAAAVARNEPRLNERLMFSVRNRNMIESFNRLVERELAGSGGEGRPFEVIGRVIDRHDLWRTLRSDAAERNGLFRPLAERMEATLPSQAVRPPGCVFRARPGLFAEGEWVYLESEDGAAWRVGMVSQDAGLAAAGYDFQLNGEDARALRLLEMPGGTRGIVYGRVATLREKRNRALSCQTGAGIQVADLS